jgi:hypothetical protein
MPNDLKPSSGREWRKEAEGVLLELPSGKLARVRGVSVQLLVRLGRIPDAMTPVIADIMIGKLDDLPVPQTVEELQAHLELIDEVARASFLEPKIVDKPKADNEITLDDVEDVDRMYLFEYLGRSTRELENFRVVSESDVELVGDAKGHGKASKRVVKPDPMGDGDNGA